MASDSLSFYNTNKFLFLKLYFILGNIEQKIKLIQNKLRFYVYSHVKIIILL